jgi:hypothetical protein
VKCLQCGLTGAVVADACRSDGVPGLLGSPLLGNRELHLRQDSSNEGIQRPSILIVVDAAISNCFPHVPHLESYPHHRAPLDVVGLGEGRSSNAGTDVPDNGLDLVVTMVHVRGGRAAPHVKAVISVDPIVDVSTPVWAVTADAPAPIWAAATARLGVRGCPLRRLLSRCLPRQLELIVGAAIG